MTAEKFNTDCKKLAYIMSACAEGKYRTLDSFKEEERSLSAETIALLWVKFEYHIILAKKS